MAIKQAVEQVKRWGKLEKILSRHYDLKKLVPLRDLTDKIVKISKVHVRECEVTDYDEISLTDMDNDGVVKIVDDSQKKSANASALERQRLHKGDLVFTYRGKIGKIGRVDHEHERPLIGNHGMMKIMFHEDKREDMPKYIQAYLQTNLIKTFLAETMEDRQLTPELIGGLPIPFFESMEGMSTFVTIYDKRCKIREALEVMLDNARTRENEALLMINKPLNELSMVNAIDNQILSEIESLGNKMDVSIPEEENVFLRSFTEVGEE